MLLEIAQTLNSAPPTIIVVGVGTVTNAAFSIWVVRGLWKVDLRLTRLECALDHVSPPKQARAHSRMEQDT